MKWNDDKKKVIFEYHFYSIENNETGQLIYIYYACVNNV